MMQPRLTSRLRVEAMLRMATSAGVTGAILRRGDAQAGSIYIKIARLDGTADLYGPAPGPGLDDAGRPRWSRLRQACDDADAEAYVQTRARVDPDLWLIEIEDRDGRAFLDGILETEAASETDPLLAAVFGPGHGRGG